MQNAVSVNHQGFMLRGMEHIPDGENLPAVILLHGFTGHKLEGHRLFLEISRALEEEGFASFRFDFLGSGESDGDFKEMTVSKELAEAETILDFVKAHPKIDSRGLILLGFSMGGLVASLLAGKRGSDLEKLILIAPAGTMGEKADAMKENSIFIEEEDAYDIGGNLVGTAFFDDLKAMEVWEPAAAFSGKVQLIHGTEDQAVPYRTSHLYIEKCYGDKAELRTIEGSDHTFNSYYWQKDVIETIRQFVKE